ncbi:MAG TPA: M23 family metallopeptidase [Bacteroidales bacterium]|nr:M23 family metallopeptidase [Bacteroidales bacterium]
MPFNFKPFITLVFTFFFNTLFCQQKYNPPLATGLKISGGFADVRNGTFHFGLDFSTEKKTGIPVLAINSGYLARIKVEPGGYGKALYIKHADGTMSVYAHLQSFNDTIDSIVKEIQYNSSSFAIDYTFDKTKILVKKSDTIAFSGNSGQSTGPHLHFEIRDDKSQKPLNPLSFLKQIKDSIPPVIEKLLIYKPQKYINKLGLPYYKVTKKDTTGKPYIKVPQNFGIGIDAYDNITDSSRKFAFYEAKLFFDNILIYHMKNDSLAFDNMASVKGIVDYNQKTNFGKVYYYMFKFPCNQSIVNKYAFHDGLISLQDTFVHSLKVEVKDNSGNTASWITNIKADSALNKTELKGLENYKILCHQQKEIKYKEVMLIFPSNCLFTDVLIDIKQMKPINSTLAPVVKVGDPGIPLYKAFYIYFDIKVIADSLKKKLVVVSLDENNKAYSIGGEILNNTIKASARSFGKFSIALDTVAPKIVPFNVNKNKLLNKDSISFEITDNLSGIEKYEVYIDNKWALFEYDLKSNTIYFTNKQKKKNLFDNPEKLVITVWDKRNNYTTKQFNFAR